MIINGKDYVKVKEYPNFTLYINEYGIRECFQKFDLTEHKQEKRSKQKYALFDNGELIGVYIMSEIVSKLKKPQGSIYSAMIDRRLYEGRWKIERV